jgi:hypothetical protein
VGTRLESGRVAWGCFAALALVSIAVIGFEARGIQVSGDGWAYWNRLAVEGLPSAMFDPPPGTYLIALPLLTVLAPLGELFGIEEYLPLRLVGIGLVVLAAALLFELTRRRAGNVFGLAAGSLMLFLGAAGEVVVTPVRIPGLIATCAGLGMMLALDREDRRGDGVAAALGVVGIASHPVVLPFLAAAGVRIGFGAGSRLRRLALVVALPVALFGLWQVVGYEQPDTIFRRTFTGTVEFAGDHLVSLVSTLTGTFRGPWADGTDFINAVAVAIAIVAAVALVVLCLRRRGISLGLAAALAALIVAAVAPVIGPSGVLFRMPEAPRYIHPGAIIGLWVIAEAIAAGRPWPSWVRPVAAFAATACLVGALISNVAELRDQADEEVRRGDVLRAELGALELARDIDGSTAAGLAAREGDQGSRLALAFSGGQLGPRGAGAIVLGAPTYFDIEAEYGTPAIDADEIPTLPEGLRQQVDLVLGFALPLEASTAGDPPPGECSDIEPGGTATVAPGGALVNPGRTTDAVLRVGLFADEPSYPVPIEAGGAYVALPDVVAGREWKLQADAERPVTVCVS